MFGLPVTSELMTTINVGSYKYLSSSALALEDSPKADGLNVLLIYC